MSVSFDIKEHLQVRKKDADDISTPLSIMRGQLTALAALMLIDRAEIGELKMTADGVDYSFSGNHPSLKFKKLFSVMADAKDVDLSVRYSYSSSVSWQMYQMVGPFPLMEYMNHPDEGEKESLSDVFYSAWYCADGSCPGELAAYGTRNGKTYSGAVDLEQVSSIPGGEWDELTMPMLIEANNSLDAASDPKLGEVLRDLAGMGHDTDLFYYNNCFNLYLNNLDISSDEKTARLTELTHQLVSLAPEDAGVRICGAFVDLSGDDARMLTIDYNENGFDYRIAEVA